MFYNYQNTLCVDQDVFLDLNLLSYTQFQDYCRKEVKKLNRIRTKGNGRKGLIEYKSIPEQLKQSIIKAFGNPYIKEDRETFTIQLKADHEAINFMNSYRYDNGSTIPEGKKKRYICEAEILHLYNQIIINNYEKSKLLGKKENKTALKKKLSLIINELKTECYPDTTTRKFPHNLPSNVRALDRKLAKFLEEGYESLPHKNKGNKAALKIKGANAKWLLAQYSLPNKIVVPVLHNKYNGIAGMNGWPELSESAIYKWLYEEEQERQWIISRDGIDAFRKKYGHKLVRDKDQWFPNAYWAIDGTKLDWMHYYDNDLGAAAKLKIDPVIDVYSEKILGWSYSETENHIDHFNAVKHAFNTAQSRPYLFTYDGQSGHTSDRMKHLYNKMVAKQGGTHYKHAAYRHGSPVEQLFNRIQQQVLNTWWWSDKQSIQVRTNNNKPNMEFIKDNLHKLKTQDELKKAWEISVNEWNNAPHPKFKNKSRNEVYNEEPLMQETVNYLDMIEMFWIYATDDRTYEGDGIKPIIAKTQYHYEVYTVTGEIDLRFREKWVGKKFYVKYDPSQLDNYVSLYIKLPDGDMEFVADAQPVRKQQQIPALMQDGDKAQFEKDFQIRKTEEAAAKSSIKRVQTETGITPNRLIEDQETILKFNGKVPKQLRSDAEALSAESRM